MPSTGRFALDLPGYPPACVNADERGQAFLYGQWSDCRRIRFEPRESDLFERSSIEASALFAPRETLVSRRRDTALTRFVLHPTGAVTDTRPDLRPQAGEVARILEVPLVHLTDPLRIAVTRRSCAS